MKTLTEPLRTLLLMAVRQTGSYDPDDTLPAIEERLTGPEYAVAEAFLRWVGADREHRAFGHGNIERRYQQFREETSR